MEGRVLQLKWMKLIFFTTTVLFLVACNEAEIETETYEEIEVYMTGFEKNGRITGYKRVNAITIKEVGEDFLKTDVKSVEDFYDSEGNYLRTEIKHSRSDSSKIFNKENKQTLTKEFEEPATILIPNDVLGQFDLPEMTADEKKQVKEHVLLLMEKL